MKSFGIVCGLACCVAAAVGQTNKTQTLSLEDAVQMALEHNLNLKIQRFNPQLDKFSLQAAYGSYYEPSFFAGLVDTNYDNPPRYTGAFTSPAQNVEDEHYQFGIGGANGGMALTPWGTEYSLGTSLDKSLYQPFAASGKPTAPFTQDTTFAGLTLQQPLLKNFWIDPNRAAILVAKKVLQSDEYGFTLAVMTNISATEQAYDELNYALENVKVQIDATNLAYELVVENTRRVQAGVLTELDVAQSQSQLASSVASLLAAQQLVDEDENIFKSLVTEKFRDLHDVKLLPSEKLTADPAMFDLEESWQTALAKRPDLLQAKVAIERLDIAVRLQKNQLYPQLDLTGSYGRTGLKPTLGGAYNDIPADNFPSYAYGLVLNVPLGNTAARNNYRAAAASKEQAQAAYQLAEQNVLIQIQNTIERARSDFAQTKATRDAREYAELALEQEQKKLGVGTSTPFIVLQLQSNLTAARSAEIRALANYNEDLSLLSEFEGTVLEKHHLTVKIY